MTRPLPWRRRITPFAFALLVAACVDDAPLSPEARSVPDVPQLADQSVLDSIRTIAGGEFHACGLDVNGKAWCWGMNAYGQLGHASDSTCLGAPCSVRPKRVTGNRVYTHLAAGTTHSCGIEAGTHDIYCWGTNVFGQLGDPGAPPITFTPVRANVTGDFLSVTAGQFHTCALAATGRVWCWGYNHLGQATGDSIFYFQPRAIAPVRSYVMVSGGANHTCAIGENGLAYCWGENTYEQLGDSAASNSLSRTVRRVNGPGGYTWIAAGVDFTCAIRGVNDWAWCWGSNNQGQGGRATFDPTSTPTRVVSNRHYTQLSAGSYHACGLESAGRITCWGLGSHGQLGNGDSLFYSLPVRTRGTRLYHSLALGTRFGGCATDDMNDAYCWGNNTFGSTGRRPAISPTCFFVPCNQTPARVTGTVVFEPVAPPPGREDVM